MYHTVNERDAYESSQSADCADEESSPVDLHSPLESLPCSSPLRVAPSEGASTLISRDNNSSVCNNNSLKYYICYVLSSFLINTHICIISKR